MTKSGIKAARKPSATLHDLRIHGSLQPQLSDEFLVVRTQPLRGSKSVPKSSERTQTLIERVGKALKDPGIRKNTVFKRGVNGLYAYSVDLQDPKKIVRRSSNGKKVTGRLVQGRFRAG